MKRCCTPPNIPRGRSRLTRRERKRRQVWPQQFADRITAQIEQQVDRQIADLFQEFAAIPLSLLSSFGVTPNLSTSSEQSRAAVENFRKRLAARAPYLNLIDERQIVKETLDELRRRSKTR